MSRSQRAANQADFAGPDADREAIERLARSARLANEQQRAAAGWPTRCCSGTRS